jgi:hypothetical protein
MVQQCFGSLRQLLFNRSSPVRRTDAIWRVTRDARGTTVARHRTRDATGGVRAKRWAFEHWSSQ